MRRGLQGLGGENRLRRAHEFRYVRAKGRRRASAEFLLVEVEKGEGETPRLGMVVSRKVGNAVVRNALKRGIREWFRLEGRELLGSSDLVVVARAAAAKLSGRKLWRQLSRQLLSSRQRT